MAKPIFSHIIKDRFSDYESFLKETKLVDMPFVAGTKGIAIKGKKAKQHNLKGQTRARCSNPYGPTFIYCEIKSDDNLKYSISLIGEDLDTKILARFDSQGGTHRNIAPGTPLHKQEVPSPHIHYFDDSGYLIAETVDFKGNSTSSIAIDIGFSYFCTRNSIISSDPTKTIAIHIARQPALDMGLDDPHRDVDFK